MSLSDLAAGRLTFLELEALIAKLPPESALRTAQRDQLTDEELEELGQHAEQRTQGHGPWSHSDSLIAALVDAVQVLIHVQLARAGVKSSPPAPIRRPGVVDKTRQSLNPQQIAFLERIRQSHADQQQAAEEAP